MFSFGREFFSPSGRVQDLQRGGSHNNNQQTSSSSSGGFLTNTAIGSSTGGSSNIHTIPSQPESGYHIEDPIHIKVKNWFLYFPLCSNIVFCVCIILYIVQGVFNEPKSSDICYRYSTTILTTKVWQLFTFPFFHGSITHILFNMLALYQFGNRIESTLGTIYFFFISLFMIIFGSAVWVAIDALFIQGFGAGQTLSFLLDRCTVGYSGVLFGYLVFTVQYRPLFEQLYPGANADDFAPKLIPWLMLIVTSLLMPNVSLMGHLTGMISGYLIWILVRFVTPINKVFLFIDRKIPKFIRERSFYFVSNEAVFTSATAQTNQQDTQSTPSQPSSGGFMSSISGWFRGGNNNSNDQSANNHSWGSGRALGSN
ncbi:rhomboid domain-containing protein [Naegleria gruberi]|uniref:Rhomboid domain-containing protein n=1 Tax=Naegleria gruberi TaxID=5762 RepID=D2V1P3_NAEGR|nr:rhomboid domain-containing protein [Naegleria gruberi]EFC49345.1 rhomboid domain-containing protein [Naegleria gruberi]|eukprot:XP_002682089.1 rhomboid domain-containing protein [Naegleria gruberi strain NEG-M]